MQILFLSYIKNAKSLYWDQQKSGASLDAKGKLNNIMRLLTDSSALENHIYLLTFYIPFISQDD